MKPMIVLGLLLFLARSRTTMAEPPAVAVHFTTIPTIQQDSVQKFVFDLANLHSFCGENPVLTPTHCKRDSSYTKAWTNADWDNHQVRSFWRYRRHLLSWAKSPTALAVLPTVASVVVWSLVVSWIARTSKVPIPASFSMGLTSFVSPISLLLALRTNHSLNRLLEARSMFGKMVRATASLAGQAATYIAPLDLDKALLMGRYLSIYGWTVKGAFREEDTTNVCRAILPQDEAAWLEGTPADTPTSIICRLRQLIATIIEDLPLTAANAMEDRLCELEVILGTCKRLIGSPIPPTYTRHTSRVLCLYLGLLPVALVASNAPLVAILINVALLSYVFVGIDEIGVEIEHPFPLLPMYHISSTIQRNVGNQFLMMEQHGSPS
jgi:predicted membrane chloride channel (bestrophin family)